MAKYGKLSIIGLLLLLFVSNSLAHESDKKQIDLLITGSFHGESVVAENGEEWFCLYKKGEECFVSRAKVRIDMYHDRSADEPITDSTGKKVSVPGIDGEVIFLFRGVDSAKEGHAKTVFHGEKFFYPGENLLFHSSNLANENEGKPEPPYSYWEVGALGTATNVDFKNEIRHGMIFYSIYDLYVNSEKETQIICEMENLPEHDTPFLIWAGDLDGDEKLDLFYNLSYHYNIYLYGLFLSSFAEEGEFVKEVAKFESWGC